MVWGFPSSWWWGAATGSVQLAPARGTGDSPNGIFVPVEPGLSELALLDARKTLDAEIAARRRGGSGSAPGSGARKRARDDDEAEAEGAVSLAELDLVEDRFVVVNSGADACTLDGWTVRSEGGEQQYSFPDGTELEGGGGRLTVWSGAKNRGAPNRRGRSPGQHLWWTARYIWNDGAQTPADDRAPMRRSLTSLCFLQAGTRRCCWTGTGMRSTGCRSRLSSRRRRPPPPRRPATP